MQTRQPATATQAARLGANHAGLEATDGDGLVPGPDLGGEGADSAAQNGVGTIVEQLERWNDAAPTDPDERGGEELCWQLAGQLDTRFVPRQGKSGNIQSF